MNNISVIPILDYEWHTVEISGSCPEPIEVQDHWEIVTELNNEISNSLYANKLQFWHHHRSKNHPTELQNVYIFYSYEDYQIAKFLI
jgi:hypothetical protein